MSKAIRLGVTAGLVLAASTPAWAADRPDEKAAGGDVWFDEFYASAQPSPVHTAPVATTAAAHRADGSTATGQVPRKRAHGVAHAHRRGHHRHLARNE